MTEETFARYDSADYLRTEEDIAAYASRLIVFADGKVRSDGPVPERVQA